ncbi:MAG: sec-independent protein translocase protein TatA, partial [Pseudonocardiales bacterium]|nr:sec-independent protein translocase protein TatA [Pseudonocardiales bacterium]
MGRMGAMSPTHWLVLVVVVVILFGAKKLPEAARGLGRSARILKSEV